MSGIDMFAGLLHHNLLNYAIGLTMMIKKHRMQSEMEHCSFIVLFL